MMHSYGFTNNYIWKGKIVLILVVMDDALVLYEISSKEK